MSKTIHLNIDKELSILDSVFQKYMPVIDNLIFVKWRRFPVERKNIRAKQEISNTPFHPYLSVASVEAILRQYVSSKNPYKELLKYNKYIKSGGNSYYPRQYDNDFCIVEEHLGTTTNDINDDDLVTIAKMIKSIKIRVSRYLTNDLVRSVFNIKTETNIFELHFGPDIRAIRYEELEYGDVIETKNISHHEDRVYEGDCYEYQYIY